VRGYGDMSLQGQQAWILKAEPPEWVIELARHEQQGFVERWSSALVDNGVEAVNVTFNGGWPDLVSLDANPAVKFDSAKTWPFENVLARLVAKRDTQNEF
jgi:hypothetical protein